MERFQREMQWKGEGHRNVLQLSDGVDGSQLKNFDEVGDEGRGDGGVVGIKRQEEKLIIL